MKVNNEKIFNNIIISPVKSAIVFAIYRCTELFPNNKGKVYLSNILAFFVNEINHKELINKFGLVPKLNKESLTDLLKDLIDGGLISFKEGSRNAFYVYLDADEYMTYMELFNRMTEQSVDNDDIRNVGFALQRVNKLFPNNKGKAYISNVLGYFVNEANHVDILNNLLIIPKYSYGFVNNIFNKMSDLKIISKQIGKNGAVYCYLNEDNYNAFVSSLNRTFDDSDLIFVTFVSIEVTKMYPNNKGKVYATNILSYILNDINKPLLTKRFNQIKSYTLLDVNNIFAILSGKGLCKRYFGNRGATYIVLDVTKCEEFIKPRDVSFTDEDKRLLLYCAKHLEEQYPNNKGKVYISNLAAFIKMTRNVELLTKELNYYRCLDKYEINILTDILKEEKLIGKFEGNRGADYILIYRKAREIYFRKDRTEFSDEELKAIVYAVRKLREQYPNNKGKVYVSNLHAYFRNDKNKESLNNEFGFLPVFTKNEIELIVKKLSEDKILIRKEGGRGATYVLLDDQKFEEKFNREFTDIDFKVVVYAARELRKRYPRNNGKIYVSNLYAFFQFKWNKEEVTKEFGLYPEYSRNDLETIVTKLAELEIVFRHIGNRGATYITLDDKKFEKQFCREITDLDYRIVVYAARDLRARYPKNKGKVYVSNLYTFFQYKWKKNEIINEFELEQYPEYSREDLENIVDKLNELEIVTKCIGIKGAIYIIINDQKFDARYTPRVYTREEFIAIVFAVRFLRKKYPKNKGKVYVSNLHAFFKIDANFPMIQENLGWLPKFSKDELEEIVKKLSEMKILYRHEGLRGATYVTLDDSAFDRLIGEKEPEPTLEDKEKLIEKILFIMNGKCYISTIDDIIFNNKSPYIGEENNKLWLNQYFPNRRIIKNTDDLDDVIVSLYNKNIITVSGEYIKLTWKGIKEVQIF